MKSAALPTTRMRRTQTYTRGTSCSGVGHCAQSVARRLSVWIVCSWCPVFGGRSPVSVPGETFIQVGRDGTVPRGILT